MSFIPPYAVVIKNVLARKRVAKATEEDRINEAKSLIKMILKGVAVDEEWYRDEYPDVAKAIAAGHFSSGKQHFVEEGYFEGRLPSRVVVDEQWYLRQYEDVRKGVADGSISSATEHYALHGLAEGRLPSEY